MLLSPYTARHTVVWCAHPNCTTTLDAKVAADSKNPQRRKYDRGRLVMDDGLTFPELKRREHINAAAQAGDGLLEWAALIRGGRGRIRRNDQNLPR
jgi:hypothetical protein